MFSNVERWLRSSLELARLNIAGSQIDSSINRRQADADDLVLQYGGEFNRHAEQWQDEPSSRSGRCWVLQAVAICLLVSGQANAQTVETFDPHGGRSVQVTLGGNGFTGAGSVDFNGTPATAFTVSSDTEILATAPADFVTGPVSVGAVSSSFHFINRTGAVATVGPVSGSALPLGALVSYSGAPNDGSISQSGGQTFNFESLALSNSTWLYWGAASGGVKLSMNGNDFDSPSGEVMTYSSDQSDLAAGKLVYTGSSALSLLAPWPSGSDLCTRFSIQFLPYNGSSLAWFIPATEAGLPADIGAVAAIAPGQDFSVNLLFEAAYTSDDCTAWSPALVLYDAAPTNPVESAWSSFTGGFFYENTAPEIGDIADQTVTDGGSTGAVGFSLTDAETASVGTTLVATSDNQLLAPDANIVLDGTGSARTVDVTALAGQTGSALITLVAMDSAGASSSRSFTLSTNELPTISPISDLMVQYNQTSGDISFTVSDIETADDDLVITAQSSNTTLVPAANIVLGGSGTNRTIKLQPFLSQTGSTTITITVADQAGGEATADFVFRVNAPPMLINNLPGHVLQGGDLPMDNNLLKAADPESPPSEIHFTLNPDGTGTVPNSGELRLDGVVLDDLDSFTQADIDSGRLSYHNDDSCNPFDLFTFNVNDGEGGVTPSPPLPTSYRFNIGIELRNDPPTASAGSMSVGLSASAQGQLQGEDDDCLTTDVLIFAIPSGSEPTRGTISSFDPATGAFAYTAGPGEVGADGFDFTVSDGTSSATAHFSIVIENQAPVVSDTSVTTPRETPVSGTVVATDVDLPAQLLTFAIDSNGSKGVATIDTDTGQFQYTPSAGRIGSDQFSVIANDGIENSLPGIVTVQITSRMDAGEIVTVSRVPGTLSGAVVVVAPATGDQALVALSDELENLNGVAADAGGNIYVTGQNGLLHVSAATGAVTVLDGSLGLGIGVRLDPAGRLMVAEGPAGISIRNPDGTVISSYSGGSLQFATDVALGSDGYLYVSDAGVFASGANKIVRIDPATSTQNIVVGTGLEFPVSLVFNADGKLLVGDGLPDLGQSSALRIVDPVDGSVSTVSDLEFNGLAGIDVTDAGVIYASNQSANNVLRLSVFGDPQVIVSQNGLIAGPFGLAIVKSVNATITLQSPLNPIYDASPHRMTVSTNPSGLEGFVELTYTPQGGGTPLVCVATDTACGPVDAGSYDVLAHIAGDSNHFGSASAILVIGKATGTVAWEQLEFVYDGSSPTVIARITLEPTTSCTVTGAIAADVGSYPVRAECSGRNYDANGDSYAVITPQPITITLSGLLQTYDGLPKPVTQTTAPTLGVALTILYDGNSTPPIEVGDYAVGATSANPNYAGSTSAILSIVRAEFIDLSASIIDPREYVQLYKLHTYAMAIQNNGNTAVSGATVSDILPASLDVTQASWTCFALGNAVCTPQGSGDLHDTIDLPVDGGVIYVLTAPVQGDSSDPSESVINTVTVAAAGDGDSTNDSASEVAQAVLLRDSFERASNGAQWPQGATEAFDSINLTGAETLPIAVAVKLLAPSQVTTLVNSTDGAFRIEAIRIEEKVWLRIVAGEQRVSPWSELTGTEIMLGLGVAEERSTLILVGTVHDLQMDLPSAGPFGVRRRND